MEIINEPGREGPEGTVQVMNIEEEKISRLILTHDAVLLDLILDTIYAIQ